jgi:four helix bundle protein
MTAGRRYTLGSCDTLRIRELFEKRMNGLGIGRALRPAMRSEPAYKQLDTWQQAMTLVERCYEVTSAFPRSEMYGLTNQIRRAAVSIPSNVAEGFCRRKTKAYANHVSIALGSHGELETCLELAARLGFLSRDKLDLLEQMTTSVGSLLSGLHRSLEDKIAREKATSRSRSS